MRRCVPVMDAEQRKSSGSISTGCGAHAVEAAEQSERLSVPELHPPQALGDLHRGVAARSTPGRVRRDRRRRADRRGRSPARPRPNGVLTGPEGGFAETELDALGKLSFVSRAGLGPRVLRADTAALAALAVLQAIAGDGRGAGRARGW